MQHTTDLIKVAVEAAGGRIKAAQALGVSPWTVTGWQRTRRMPADKIRPLCSLGGVLTPEQILAYIEKCANERFVA